MPHLERRRHRSAAHRLAAIAFGLAVVLTACSSSNDATPPATSAETTDGTAAERVLDQFVAHLGLDTTASECVLAAAAGAADQGTVSPDATRTMSRQLVDAVDTCQARAQLISQIASDLPDPESRTCAERVLNEASADDLALVIASDTTLLNQCAPTSVPTTAP